MRYASVYGIYANKQMASGWARKSFDQHQGAGRVLTLLGIDIEGIFKRGHCPLCGTYLGKRDPDDINDPECFICGWMGKI